MKSLLSYLLRRPGPPKPALSPEQRTIIRNYAETGTGRDEAMAIYHQQLSTLGPDGSLEMRFMSEVDNPVPDLALRGRYRKELLTTDELSS